MAYTKEYLQTSRKLRRLVQDIVGDSQDDVEKIHLVASWIQDSIKCESPILALHPIRWDTKDILKHGSASALELNLLLAQMLRTAGLEADPVFLFSSRSMSFRDVGKLNHAIVLCENRGEPIFADVNLSSCTLRPCHIFRSLSKVC